VSDPTLISCLCVTRNRVEHLRRSVNCFLAQSYPTRELILVYESDDAATRCYVATLTNPMIVPVEVRAGQMNLGALRNFSIRESHGDYIAQWDDDDWFSPLRLECQYENLIKSGKSACLLSRWIVYDAKTGRGYISNSRAWEGSLLCRKAAMVAYPELSMGEDTPVVQHLLDASQVTLLERPELYIYAYHGGNVWDRPHWEEIFRCSTRLDPDLNRTIKGLMTLPGHRLGWIRNILHRWGKWAHTPTVPCQGRAANSKLDGVG